MAVDERWAEMGARVLGEVAIQHAIEWFARSGEYGTQAILRSDRADVIMLVVPIDGESRWNVIDVRLFPSDDKREYISVIVEATRDAFVRFMRCSVRRDEVREYALCSEAWMLRTVPGQGMRMPPRDALNHTEALVVQAESKGPPVERAIGVVPIHKNDSGEVAGVGLIEWGRSDVGALFEFFLQNE